MLVKYSTPEANTLLLCSHIHSFMLQSWVYYICRRTHIKLARRENKEPGDSHPSENDSGVSENKRP